MPSSTTTSPAFVKSKPSPENQSKTTVSLVVSSTTKVRFSTPSNTLAIFHPSVELVSSIGTLIVIYFGGLLVFHQTLPVADLVAYFLYLDMLYQPVRILSQSWEQLQESLASANRVESLFKETSEIKNIPNPLLLPQRATGHLHLNNINFAYIDGIPVLENINLDIPAHSVLALRRPHRCRKIHPRQPHPPLLRRFLRQHHP